LSALIALARSPREGVAAVLRDGRLGIAVALVAAATVLSVAHTLRYANEVDVEEVVFGPGRNPAVSVLLAWLGRDMTAVVVHLFQTSWTWLLALGAVSPFLIWLLGATAVHAAARLAGIRRPFLPLLVLLGYVTGITRPVTDLAALAAGPRAADTVLPVVAATVAIAWLGLLAWHGIRAHYGVPGGRALALLVVAVVFFYLAPLTLILLALVAILLAAILLEYVPAP
jgi:hypothetical protein